MYRLRVKQRFAAAHFIPGHTGACAGVHGHTWQVEAVWEFDVLDELGMGADFAALKARMRALLPDHKDLNTVYDFPPTAENLARHFCDKLDARSVVVHESEDCSAEYVAGR